MGNALDHSPLFNFQIFRLMGYRYITDIFGQRIEVTDLPAAIAQCEMYAGWDMDPPKYVAEGVTCQQYWQDAYEKLLRLKEALPQKEGRSKKRRTKT